MRKYAIRPTGIMGSSALVSDLGLPSEYALFNWSTTETTKNFQNNIKNTKRRLFLERLLLPFNLIPVSVSPVSIGTIIDDQFLIPPYYLDLLKENDLGLTEKNGKHYGMIINVVPDDLENVHEGFSLKGHITILDAVGNIIIEKKKMGWHDEKKRLIFAWSLKNSNGRYVGSGMYLCLIEIEETTTGPENSGLKEMKRLMVGVK